MAAPESDEIHFYHRVTGEGDPAPKSRLAPLDIEGRGTGEVIEGTPLPLAESTEIFNSPNTLIAISVASSSLGGSYGTHKEEYIVRPTGSSDQIEEFNVDVTNELRRPPVYAKQALRRAVATRVPQRPLNIVV